MLSIYLYPSQADYSTLTEEELSAMTVVELKVIAKDLGVVGYSSMLKADLIQAILVKLG